MPEKIEINPDLLGHKSFHLWAKLRDRLQPLDTVPLIDDQRADLNTRINSAADSIYTHACHDAIKNLPHSA